MFQGIFGRFLKYVALPLHVTKTHIFRAGHGQTLEIIRGKAQKAASGEPCTAKRPCQAH